MGGSMFYVEDQEDGAGAFRACLDVGLARTSTGAKVFAALKGAVDGGIDIPHSEKRFPGYDTESKELNADVHRQHIFGLHVANYMTSLQEEDEEVYKKAHAAIRADPAAKKAAPKNITKKRWTAKKIGLEARRAKVNKTKEEFLAQLEQMKE